jgi:hypothetical protein
MGNQDYTSVLFARKFLTLSMLHIKSSSEEIYFVLAKFSERSTSYNFSVL